METNKIYNGDCINLLKQLDGGSIDICFADPPFNLGKKYNAYKDKQSKDEYLHWCQQWMAELVRVTKDTGSIFIHNIPYWLSHYCCYLNEMAQFRHWIAWDAPTSPMGKSLQPSHYGILYYVKDVDHRKFYELRHLNKRCRKCNYLAKDYGGKKDTIPAFGPLVSDCFTEIESADICNNAYVDLEFGPILSDYWTDIHRIKHNKYRDAHPCQLPIPLLERIILMSTDENDIVLDPFMGTGTTAIAAKRLGRKYIGFEISKEYCDAAENKLQKESEKSNLGGCWVGYHLGKVITVRHGDWPKLKDYFEIPNPIKKLDSESIKLID